MPREIWKPVKGYKGFYSVSNLGNVRGEPRKCRMGHGRMRKVEPGIVKSFECPHTHYPKVRLFKGDGGKTFAIHILVLTSFVGPKKRGLSCAHSDGNRMNSTLSNLRWATASENEKDKLKHGTHNRGERHYGHKLTQKDVRAIRSDERAGMVIAAEYGIVQATVSRIKTRQRWAHLS
jgi:hypothetical protein